VADLTVMSYNVYNILIAPARENRSAEIATWFKNVGDNCPDVLVLQESWHEDLMTKLCSSDYGGNEITACDSDSPFSAATPVANPVEEGDSEAINSGVAILVKKGITMEWNREWDLQYVNREGFDVFAKKGCQLVKVTKDGMDTYVVGTHIQSMKDSGAARLKQFKEMADHVKAKVPADSNVVFAGDMNTEDSEIEAFLTTVTSSSEKPTGLELDGFWSDNATPVSYSASNSLTPADERELTLDWVVPARLDSLKNLITTSQTMRYQYVRVQSAECFSVSLGNSDVCTADLADHYAVFAQICDSTCASQSKANTPKPDCSDACSNTPSSSAAQTLSFFGGCFLLAYWV